MKKALVHDWFTVYAGAEKCVESFTNIWDDFDFFSLIDFLSHDDRQTMLKGKYSTTSFIQKLPKSKDKYRNYLPLFPFAVEQLDLSEYELILSSSHAVAKGVLTRPDQLHICYIYSPIRYAWDLYFQYLNESGLDKGMKGLLAKYFLHKIRMWDVSTSNRPDHYVAISKYIANRVSKIYGKHADVIYPPVDTDEFTPGDSTDDYYITFSRMVPYKKIDLIVEAFSQTDKKLIVIGDGPDFNKVKAKAGKNVELLSHQPRETIIELTKKAKAFIFAAEEDFGIAPIEAQACGVPVIAFGKGGALETIRGIGCHEQVGAETSGVFFDQQTVKSMLAALEHFEKNQDRFDKVAVRNNALRFSRCNFETQIKDYVDAKYSEFTEKGKI